MTTLWIKVKWEECETSGCWVIWTEEKCIKKESDWILVPPPRNQNVPYVEGQWANFDAGRAEQAKRAIDKVVEAACAGKSAS